MENSQWDAKMSGMEANLGRKRDSILAQTNELKDKPSNVQITPAKVRCSQIGVTIKSVTFCT